MEANHSNLLYKSELIETGMEWNHLLQWSCSMTNTLLDKKEHDLFRVAWNCSLDLSSSLLGQASCFQFWRGKVNLGTADNKPPLCAIYALIYNNEEEQKAKI